MAGTAKITELAEWLSLDRTTLTRNLQVLEEAGLIQVAQGQDRRVRAISLTIEGRNAFQRSVPLWQKGQEKVKDYLGKGRLDDLLRTLLDIQALDRPVTRAASKAVNR
jgi:DNA-binding MarR family transcriptional regulator